MILIEVRKMKKWLLLLLIFILAGILLTACAGQDKVPGQEDKPNKKVPQTDEFTDPTGPEKLEEQTEKSIDENDDLIFGTKGMKEELNYQTHVKPILAEDCFGCHRKKSVVGEENVFNDYQGVMKFVTPQEPENSKLVTAIQTDNSMRKYIGAEEIRVIEQWVKTGAQESG